MIRSKFKTTNRRTAEQVLECLRTLLGAKNDRHLANIMGVAPNTVPSWRHHDRIPYELVLDIAERYGLSLDEVLLGREAMEKSWTLPTMPEGDPDSLPFSIVVNRNVYPSEDIERLMVVSVPDSLMVPTMEYQDLAVVEKANGKINPGLYAIHDGCGVVIRRLFPGKKGFVRVIYDNSLYPPYDVPEGDIAVLGRVVLMIKREEKQCLRKERDCVPEPARSMGL